VEIKRRSARDRRQRERAVNSLGAKAPFDAAAAPAGSARARGARMDLAAFGEQFYAVSPCAVPGSRRMTLAA